jgi:hypothetical protein
MKTFSFSPRVVPIVLGILAAISLAAMIHGHFSAGPVIADEGREGGTNRVITGRVTVRAMSVLTLLEPEPGKAFFGHITARGTLASDDTTLTDTYEFQAPIEGKPVHVTGTPTHMPATKDQNADFVGESLQVHNFGANDIVLRFAVSFSRRHLDTE